jgi:two-component system KDP operon response regulator KdpE
VKQGLLYAASTEPAGLLSELGSRTGLPVVFSTHTDLIRRFRAVLPRLVVCECDAGPDELFRDIREVRAESRVPLLAVVGDARTGTEALEIGADMVARQPAGPDEMALRVESLLRRAEAAGPEGVYRDAEVELDRVRHRVVVRGRELQLTPTEFRMLEALVERPGLVWRHRDLIEATWGDRFHARDEVKLYVSYLRRKFATVGVDPIDTVRGIGYRYAPKRRLGAAWSEAGRGLSG